MNTDFEPFKPINTLLYLFDNKFHTEALTALLADDNRFGSIDMDSNGALFGTLQRLQAKIIKLVEVSYGGENGFNQVRCWFCYCYMDILFQIAYLINEIGLRESMI